MSKELLYEYYSSDWNRKLQLHTVKDNDFIHTQQQAEDLPPQFEIKGLRKRLIGFDKSGLLQ
jgi:hypothetical protein